MSEAQDFAREADALLERITLLFAGKTLELVRAVINDLTAQ